MGLQFGRTTRPIDRAIIAHADRIWWGAARLRRPLRKSSEASPRERACTGGNEATEKKVLAPWRCGTSRSRQARTFRGRQHAPARCPDGRRSGTGQIRWDMQHPSNQRKELCKKAGLAREARCSTRDGRRDRGETVAAPDVSCPTDHVKPRGR